MFYLKITIFLSVFVTFVFSQITCNSSQSCPESMPCCSQYGVCGSGSSCLGGCDPSFSFKPYACMPMPICQNSVTNFDNYRSQIASSSSFLGDPSKATWVSDGYPLDYPEEQALILAMPKDSAGTVISSTRYIWYGKVTATLKTSHLGGVVTAFILFSNIKDEIDFEFVGAALTTVQTNFYFEGILNYTNGANISASNTFENYHVYEVDWQEDYIKWSVDGVVGRTLYKNQTWNATSKVYQFPQTPSRIQFSIWPGGNATNAVGTIQWAGGLVNWNAPDLTDPGYYYAILKSVSIECYSPPANTVITGNKSYSYDHTGDWLQNGISITDDNTILGSIEDSGLDASKSSSSSSSSTSTGTHSTHNSKGHTKSSSAQTDVSTSNPSQATGFIQNTASASVGGGNINAVNPLNFHITKWLCIVAYTLLGTFI